MTFTFYFNGAPEQPVPIKFVEGKSTDLGIFPLDATIECFGIGVSLSQLPVVASPLPNARVYCDHNGAHDIQSDSGTKVRPHFIVTYFPEIQNAQIRFTLENCKASATGECHAPTRFLINGAEVWSNLSQPWYKQMMSLASRPTKVFWLSPVPHFDLKYDLAYLISTGAVPSYDTSLTIPDAVISADYSNWLASSKEILDNSTDGSDRTGRSGLWLKAMETTGGRPDIGPMTRWATQWLYTGDWRSREIALGQADLASQWPLHYRDDSGKYFSITNHPSCGLYALPTDGVVKVADLDNWGWQADLAHQPDHFYLCYLLSGDYFYLEEILFWAYASAAFPNGGGTSANYGRGSTGAEGGVPGMPSGQIRQQAWALRSRAEAAWICPDAMSEKLDLTRWTNDFIAEEEGARDIHGTGFDGNQNWIWGNTFKHDVPPLHMWQTGNGAFVQGPFIPGVATALSMWEQNFMLYTLGRMKQIGFASDALLAWLGNNIVNQEATLQFWMGQNRIATSDTSGPFTTWAQVLGAYDPTFDVMADWNSRLQDLEHGWPIIALCAMAVLGPRPDWAQAEYQKVPWSNNPKWAITPRE